MGEYTSIKNMNDALRNMIPEKVARTIRFLKRQLRHVPADEDVYFDADTVYKGHFKVTYRGVSAIRCPFDYVIYQMLITNLKPDLVIEIGTNVGGGALYIADLMNTIGHGTVHTIDIKKQSDEIISRHPRIRLFTDGWQGYDVKEAAGFSKILVIEDASHMYEDSIGSLEKFSPLVSVGSYYIVEDGIASEVKKGGGFHGGPLRAIREFLPKHPDFEVDRSYCDMFGKNATFNINGYLKRTS